MTRIAFVDTETTGLCPCSVPRTALDQPEETS